MNSTPAEQRDQTVLVTGGSGYLAGWVIVELLSRGYKVRTTVRSASREGEVRANVAKAIDPGERLSFAEADLTRDDGWSDAVSGCSHVLHVASPFPPKQPKDPDDLIRPATEGTLRVLAAALDAGIERVVSTSSVAAIDRARGDHSGRKLDEGDWADGSSTKLTPYARSKTIAEQSAWKFVRDAGDEQMLTTVNPSAILGPLLGPHKSYSLELVERLLKGAPGIPRIGFSLVDARDVAWLQVEAMTSADAGGQRFIAAGPFMWMEEIAKILRERLGDDAKKVPKRRVSDGLVRLMGRFDPGVKTVAGNLGVKTEYSSDKAKRELGWQPLPVEQTIEDTARGILAAA